MTTRNINTFQDILDAMAEDPQLHNAMRQHILGEELLQLPAMFANMAQIIEQILTAITAISERLERMEERQDRMDERLERMEERQDRMDERLERMEERQDRMDERLERMDGRQGRMDERQDRMEGTLNRLNGNDYERKAARRAARLARRYLSLPAAGIVYAITAPDNNFIPDLTDRAVVNGGISDEQADDLENSDIILADTSLGTPEYAVIEVSLTVDEHDVSRARTRADILAQASNATVKAAVIGVQMLDSVQQLLADSDVTVIILPE